MKKSRLLGAVCASLVYLGLSIGAAQATTYQYVGASFTTIGDDDPPAGTYTTSMAITGNFTVNSPLGQNMPFSDISGIVTGYSFSDGRQTLTDANSRIAAFWIGTEFSTTGNEIWTWQVNVINDSPYTAAGEQRGGISIFFPDYQVILYQDTASISECVTFTTVCTETRTDSGSNINLLGSWYIAPPVPIPPALWLFGSGLLGLIGLARRNKTA